MVGPGKVELHSRTTGVLTPALSVTTVLPDGACRSTVFVRYEQVPVVKAAA